MELCSSKTTSQINIVITTCGSGTIKDCNIKKKEIVNELNSVFKNLKQKNYDYTYLDIGDGKSVAKITDFVFDDTSAVRVYCIDWSKVTEKDRNFIDILSVDISPRSVLDWLDKEAYD